MEYLTGEQIRSRLQIARNTLYLWRKQGLPTVIISRKCVRFVWADVEKWINKRNHEGTKLDETIDRHQKNSGGKELP